MDPSYYGMGVHEDERPVFAPGPGNQAVFPDFLHRQGPQPGQVTQSFPGIPTSGFFPPSAIPRLGTPWSPDPIGLRPENAHRPINFSLNHRPEPQPTVMSASSADSSRDSVIFTSPTESTPTTTQHQQPPQQPPPPPQQQQQQQPQQNQQRQPPPQPPPQPQPQTQQPPPKNPPPDHKCPKPTGTNPRPFKCGACYMMFDAICKLHKHLRCHGGNGSYFFDNSIFTAFPRFRNSINPTSKRVNPDINNTITAALSASKPKKLKPNMSDAPDLSQAKDHADFVEKLLESTLGNTEGKDGEEKDDEKSENDQNGDATSDNDKCKKEDTESESKGVETRRKRKTYYSSRRKGAKKKKGKKAVCVQCPQCSLEFPTKNNNPVEGKKREKNQLKRVTCDICHKKVNSKNALLHIKTCLGMPAFVCPQAGCGKKFRRKYTLLLHQRSHVLGTPFTCNICGLGFATTEKHAKHMYMHTENRPWKCERCWKAFKVREHLQRHMRTHTKEMPFVCHCGKAFTQDGNLKKHMRIHTGEKPYVCDICGKAFKHNQSKKKHMKAHLEIPDGPDEPDDSGMQGSMLANMAMVPHNQQPGPPIM